MTQKGLKKQIVERRSPQQARSLAKIELMFEAALRILETEDLAAFTTNRVAAVAGISIGTLYQYFPDKNALLLALVQREVEETFAKLDTLKHTVVDDSSTAAHADVDGMIKIHVRRAVHIMVNALGGRLRARKRLMLALAHSGQAHLLDEAILNHGLAFMSEAGVASGSLAAHLPRLEFVPAFVLARAVSGTLRAALLHDEHLLQNADFEHALCTLITGFLREQKQAEGSMAVMGRDGS